MAEREAEDVRRPREHADGADRSGAGIDLEELEVDRSGGRHRQDPAPDAASRSGKSGSRLKAAVGRLFAPVRSRLSSLFSPGTFLVGAGFSLVGVLVLGSILPLGGIGDLLGIALMAFLYGLVSSEAGYLEVGAAGAVVAGLWSLLGNLVVTLLGVGAPIVAVGFVGGAVAAVLGQYFGRDLRDGLTRDL